MSKLVRSFGKHVNKLRVEKKLSLKKLADACDMDKAQIQKICNGTDPRMSTLIRLAKGLGVSEQELFNFKR